jgi:hypothetical protein
VIPSRWCDSSCDVHLYSLHSAHANLTHLAIINTQLHTLQVCSMTRTVKSLLVLVAKHSRFIPSFVPHLTYILLPGLQGAFDNANDGADDMGMSAPAPVGRKQRKAAKAPRVRRQRLPGEEIKQYVVYSCSSCATVPSHTVQRTVFTIILTKHSINI